MIIGVAAGPPPVLDLDNKEESGLPSMSDMFEVVAEDLLTLNKNLQSVSFLRCMIYDCGHEFIVCSIEIEIEMEDWRRVTISVF